MSPSTPSLRPAEEADWPAIESLLMAGALPLEGAHAHLSNFIVALCNGEVAGVGGIEVYGTVALLRSIGVLPSMRGKGVGEAIVNALLQQAAAVGVERIFLLTTTAEGYFPRFGFAGVPRAEAPGELLASAELLGACPASACLMSRTLG